MSTGYRITASTGLDKGDREYQQDQICLLSHPRFAGCVMGVVADGMGGRSGGRKAADQVVFTARQLFEKYNPETDQAPELLQRLVQEAHLVIKLTAASTEQEPHSTVAAFILNPPGDCHWVHSGDSRLYHFQGAELQHRTLDHSYVQGLVNQGQLTEAQANVHPNANILTGCLGTEADPPAGAHSIERLSAGDSLIACSDGLWHYLSTEELGRSVNMLPAREACEFLLQKARSRAMGKGDNVSLIVLKFEALAE